MENKKDWKKLFRQLFWILKSGIKYFFNFNSHHISIPLHTVIFRDTIIEGKYTDLYIRIKTKTNM